MANAWEWTGPRLAADPMADKPCAPKLLYSSVVVTVGGGSWAGAANLLEPGGGGAAVVGVAGVCVVFQWNGDGG